MEPIKIEPRPTASLIPYARNPRRNDQAVPKMAGIIQEFGFRVPVIIRSDGTVVDGHLRLKAAIALGMETVPCVVADDLTETQVKALRIAVNRAAELAEWDTDLLRLEFEELKADGFSVETTGFSISDVEALNVNDAAPLDEWPELPDGEKADLSRWTFTLTGAQLETVKAAIAKARRLYDVDDGAEDGAAVACICGAFMDAETGGA